MTEDVGRPGATPAARRPGRVVTTVLALVLLLGGGTAVAVGLTGRDAVPPPLATGPSSTYDGAAGGATDSPSGTPSASDPPPRVAAQESPAPAETAAVEVAAPVRVSIPAIGVTSDLLHLGLREDRRLQVPEGDDFDTAAWYDGSPRPGEVGPAVLLGHVSSAARGPSVFFDLTRVAVGDTVEVTREDGTVATFEVYDLQQFPKDAFPTTQVYGNTEGPELRLITCGGFIAESTGRFSDNVIVFAREV
jgi:sortase (surface protein transpeptidase)